MPNICPRRLAQMLADRSRLVSLATYLGHFKVAVRQATALRHPLNGVQMLSEVTEVEGPATSEVPLLIAMPNNV
ncbi:unnamed protein product [Nippostrongylus brasiliensis]|uniref:Alpha/beta hydrolase n=1 Tax=Nippostrongylus brasiliensis TaxID=27835 RepID=A0A0N4XZA6_NIPBR|nr:unnamed protein product [Nippostrongylus brasiliensis]